MIILIFQDEFPLTRIEKVEQSDITRSRLRGKAV